MRSDNSNNITRAAFLKGAAKTAGGLVFASAVPALVMPSQAAAPAGAPALARRTIPKSFEKSVSLPVIGLGTRSMSKTEAKAVAGQTDVIHTLLDGGGTVIDTAANYTSGDSEEVIGEILDKSNKRGLAFIATKFAEKTKEGGEKSIQTSLANLQTNIIDLMFIHNMVEVETHLPTLKSHKGRTIRYIGISDTGDNQDELIKWLDQIDFIEFAYAADYRAAEKRLLPAAMEKGVACLIALPFGRGRALKAVQGKPVPEWAKAELGVDSYAQLLLKFVISHPAVTVAIPSTLNPKHMAENLAAGRGVIPDAKQREKIAAIWA